MVDSAQRQKIDAFLSKPLKLLIDGEWQEPRDGEMFDVIDPATGQKIARASRGKAADVDRAVSAARRSFNHGAWRRLSGASRSRILWKFADLLERDRDMLSELEIRDNGMPGVFANYIVTAAAEWFRHYARLTANIFGRNASGALSGVEQQYHAYTARQPMGVAGLITPWNGPLGLFGMKVAPALASGCSVVLKPAENTPLTSLWAAALALEAGIPAGVLNVVTGYGSEAGGALVDHGDVDKISFTGSTVTGKKIVQASAGNLKRVTLELGGKSPFLICDDADLDAAIAQAGIAIFANSGQVCYAGSRLFAQRKVYDKVVAGLAENAKRLKIGSGLDPANHLGPLISDVQLRRVEAYINSGKEDGAELVTGGKAVGDKGFFIEPTIFANARPDMRISREEIFGPVLVVAPFDTIDEVVSRANDTRYGLGAGIFTSDVNKAHYLADRIDAGNVWVNCYSIVDGALPFGGFKESGWGRESGIEGLEAYLEHKAVVVKLKTSGFAS